MIDESNESLEKPSSQELSKRYESSHIEVIQLYLASGGIGVELSEFQKTLLDRLRFADEMIRQNHGRYKRNEIANKIMMQFDINRDTAYKDIVNAQHVFASSY